MTFAEIGQRVGARHCMGGCGLSERAHTLGVIDPFGVVHYAERRFNRRSARRFLMGCARNERQQDPEMLNDTSGRLAFWYLHHDAVRAAEMAALCGFRIPARLSKLDRLRCIQLAMKAQVHLARDWPAIYAWARG